MRWVAQEDMRPAHRTSKGVEIDDTLAVRAVDGTLAQHKVTIHHHPTTQAPKHLFPSHYLDACLTWQSLVTSCTMHQRSTGAERYSSEISAG